MVKAVQLRYTLPIIVSAILESDPLREENLVVETIPTLTYGKVVGRFLAAVADGTADTDLYPDGIPLTGTVIFTPSAPAVLVTDATPVPVTVLPAPIVTTLDSEGYISLNGVRGVFLLATDTQATNPTNFTYKVAFSKLQYAGTNTVQYPSFDIAVPAGTIRDLSTISPVPAANGAPIIRDESVVVNAQNVAVAAAAEAQEWARLAEEAAEGNTGAVSSVAGRQGDVVLTKNDVGLGNVSNLAPADLPVSTATATALAGKAATSHTHTVSQLSDASTIGKSVATATDAPAVRSLIGAGTASTKSDVGLANVDNTADADKPVSTAQSTAIAGKYTKPGTGIPASDLASTVQTSLGKADSALQSAPVTSVSGRTGAVTLSKSDVGLANVDNTADADKPVSSAQSTAISAKYTKPASGIPSSDFASAVQTSLGKADTALQSAPVTSVAGRTGAVTLGKSDVGLGNVDNTSDANKPVSTATATALGTKEAAFTTLSYDKLTPGTTLTVLKASGVWPARPTSRTDIIVQWKGADPSPAIVSSGTGGMIDNVDIRLVTS